MIRPQTPDDVSAADWALADDEVGSDVVVVSLHQAVVDPNGARRAYCPMCGDKEPMQFVVTQSGVRYDHCGACGLLWRVDHDLDVVVGTRLVSPHTVGLR